MTDPNTHTRDVQTQKNAQPQLFGKRTFAVGMPVEAVATV